jgi:hypothetical protein
LDEIDHRGRDAELEVLGGLPETGDVVPSGVLGAETGGQRFERGDALFTE